MNKLLTTIIKKSKEEVIIKVITSLFVRGLLLVVPIYWSKTINYLTDNKINKAYYLVIIILVLTVLYYVWDYVNQRAWFKFYNKLYRECSNMVTKNNNKFDNLSLAEFTNIMNNDIDIICTFICNAITRIIQILEFFFIYSYFLSINIYIFIITVIISIIMILLLIVSGKNVQESNIKRKNSLDKKTVYDHKIFDIKNDKEDAINNFDNSTNNYLKDNFDYNMIVTSITYIILAIIEICQYAIILYGIYLVSNNRMEIGTIVLIYTYYAKIIANFNVLGTISAEYRSFIVSLKRLGRVHSQEKKATTT